MELKVIDTAKADLRGIGDELRLPGPGGRPPDVQNDIIRFFGKLGVIESSRAVEFGICAYQQRPFLVERLEQHRLTRELLYAVDQDFLMPVAPDVAGRDQPDLERAFALHIRRGTGVIFAPGAWHWVPYPFKGRSFALVGFALDTPKNDMHFYDLVPPLKMRR